MEILHHFDAVRQTVDEFHAFEDGPRCEWRIGMPRAIRIQTPGLIRHVMARGNGRMSIFLDDADYRHFTYLLGEVIHHFSIDCWNYCLMPNHYHATFQPTRPNLSEAVRRLNGGYGLWWNKRHGRVGHVFQGRFKDQIVDRDTYAVTLSRYVVMNPVRAGLVKRPEDWPWSSYRATAGRCTAPAFLSILPTLRLFGDGDELVLQERFAKFVSASTDDSATVDRLRSNERILGDRDFKDQVIRSHNGLATSDPGLTLV